MKICLNMFERQLWYLGAKVCYQYVLFQIATVGSNATSVVHPIWPVFLGNFSICGWNRGFKWFQDVSRLSSHKNRDPPRVLGLMWYHLALHKYLTHTISMTSNDSFYRSIDTHHYESNGSFGFQNTVNLPRKKWSLLMGQITICFSVPFQPRFSKPHLRAFSRHRVPVSPYSAHRKCPSHKPKCSGYDRQVLLTCRNIGSPGKLPMHLNDSKSMQILPIQKRPAMF